MRKLSVPILLAATLVAAPAQAAVITLDFDTPETGADLLTAPLVTSAGTITLSFDGADGSLEPASIDPDLVAAGGSGNALSADLGGAAAVLAFDFDVDVVSVEFVFGGTGGSFNASVLNEAIVVASFAIPSTGDGAFAGPVTLSSDDGITSLRWFGPYVPASFAAIDNLVITTAEVAEPAPLGLMGLALLGLAAARRRAGHPSHRHSSNQDPSHA